MPMTLILLWILFLLITSPQLVAQEVVSAAQIWFTVLVPTMYPSFVVIDMIENMPFIQRLSNWMFPVFKWLFHIHSPKSAFIILMSLLCGAPASTKLIQNSTSQQLISKTESENLICAFSTLSMPYTLMICQRNQLSIVLYYLLFGMLAAIWMWLFNKKEEKTKTPVLVTSSYLNCFLNSIQKNIQILVNILGILVIFKVLLKLIFQNEILFFPYFEILGGLSQTNHKLVVLTALGFLGFSVHLQIYSILEEFNYRKFLFSRIYFCLLGLLVFL